MKLSVIIPVYNAEKCIEKCLDSILGSVLSDYEIICVDDGSVDKTLAILQEYANKYNHIKVITQKNSFAGVARNHGLQYAQGEYIHFMDADDFVVGNYLRVLEIAEALDADYIKVKAEAIDMQTMESIENRQYSLSDVDNTYFNSSLSEDISVQLMLKTAPTPWAALVKKSYIEEAKLQFNDLRCSNDRSFFMKAIANTSKLAFCDELLVKHVVNNKDSLVGSRQLHFDCDIKSYEIVRDDVKTLPSELANLILRNELKNLISWYRKLDAEKKELHKETFRKHLDIEVLRRFELKILCSEWMKPVWEVLNMDALQLVDYELASLDQMNTKIEESKELIIYGAGRVANALIQYVDNVLDMKEKIKYILVKDTSKNPETIEGIPVYQLGTKAVDSYATVLVAAFEKAHRGIVRDLIWADYVAFKAVTDRVYKQLCFENNYYYNAHLQPHEYERALKDWYQEIKGTTLNLENPQTFNEKIQWIKLHGITPHITRLTDKYMVREWIKEQIGEEYLVPLIGAWNSFDEIDIDALPKRFALKCNHGCDWNAIVKDKDTWDVEEAKKKFDKWIQMNFAFRGGLQLQYKDIVPKIIAEEYLENADGDLFDYKFWCFDGKVEFIMFLSERAKELRMNNYDRNWNLLPFTYDHPNTDKPVAKPEKLEEMIVLAEKLAAGFPHVRVDFYQLNDGTIKFGEMTFTSCNGRAGWSDEAVNRRLGEMIPL